LLLAMTAIMTCEVQFHRYQAASAATASNAVPLPQGSTIGTVDWSPVLSSHEQCT